MTTAQLEPWLAALEARHLADLTFSEVSRSLRALSATYVERRDRLREGAALSGAGKRAAFALFYGPIHYLLIERIVQQVPGATAGAAQLIDLGCGTGQVTAALQKMGPAEMLYTRARKNEVSAGLPVRDAGRKGWPSQRRIQTVGYIRHPADRAVAVQPQRA